MYDKRALEAHRVLEVLRPCSIGVIDRLLDLDMLRLEFLILIVSQGGQRVRSVDRHDQEISSNQIPEVRVSTRMSISLLHHDRRIYKLNVGGANAREGTFLAGIGKLHK
jgi:hypothetical protein